MPLNPESELTEGKIFMRLKLKQQLWQWRGVLMTAPAVAAILIGVRFTGVMQLLELAALDQFFLLRRALMPEAVDPNIVIVDIGEVDVQKAGQWPMSDAMLARLLTNIRQQKPVVIGLDIYRDLPVQPGHQALIKVFETTPNLLGIEKVAGGTIVAPPPILKQRDQVASNDLPFESDGKMRRQLLYLNTAGGETVYSLSFRLAWKFLEAKGINPELTEDEQVKLGTVVFPAFNSNSGGYIRAEAEGYQLLLNYRGGNESFRHISMTEVLENKIPPDLMRDRIVLIGASAESLKDSFSTPYSSTLFTPPRLMPGVIIHANMTSQILSAVLEQRPLLRSFSEPMEWLWILAWSGTGAILFWQQRSFGGRAKRPTELGNAQTSQDRPQLPWAVVNCFLAGGALLVGSYGAFLAGWWVPLVPSLLALTCSSVALVGYIARSAAEMRKTFGRYLTDEVVASLLETPAGLKLGGERRKVTVMVSDLRGFSAISERLPPEKVVTLLNLYLGTMADVITEFNGTINEFVGDGIFVIFGAPILRPDDSQRAVACALAMQLAMEGVNQQNQQLDLPVLEMGIGINTGEVVVGNVGSQKRAKYTVVGRHVNLAARVESYTVGGQILISEGTLQDVDATLQINGEMKVEAKGIKGPLTLYDISGIEQPYNLFLPRLTEALQLLDVAVPLEFVVLEGKHLVGSVFQGHLVKLSAGGAELRTDAALHSMNNIKIDLLPGNGIDTRIGDIYAKVLGAGSSSSSFDIRFTATPPAATSLFEKLLAHGSLPTA